MQDYVITTKIMLPNIVLSNNELSRIKLIQVLRFQSNMTF